MRFIRAVGDTITKYFVTQSEDQMSKSRTGESKRREVGFSMWKDIEFFITLGMSPKLSP